MELKEIAAISGKGGLFRILKPTRSGVIVESLDDSKNKMVAGSNYRISILKEISIYTTSQDGSIPLEDVFYKIKDEFGKDTGIGPDSDGEELRAFLNHIVPDFDRERVYPSDIKKMLNWYSILLKQAPEALEKPKEEKEEVTTEAEKEKQAEAVGTEKAQAKKTSSKKNKEKEAEVATSEVKPAASKKSKKQ